MGIKIKVINSCTFSMKFIMKFNNIYHFYLLLHESRHIDHLMENSYSSDMLLKAYYNEYNFDYVQYMYT